MAELERTHVYLDVAPGELRLPEAPLPDTPFRIVVVADLAGHGEAGAPSAIGPAFRVDRDDLEGVLARVGPRLRVELGSGETLELGFSELDDFHPDRFLARTPFFQVLMEARVRLARSGDASFLREIARGPLDAPASASSPEPDVAGILSGSLLDRIVGQQTPEGPGTAPPPAEDPLRAFLRRVVAPHVVPGRDPRSEALLADLDRALGEGVRALLHHRDFQALEARWRGLDLLVRRLETGPDLTVHAVPATRSALLADALGKPPGQSRLAKVLRDVAGDAGPAVVVVDVAFGPSREDVELLAALAATVRGLGAALVAEAAPEMVGLEATAGLPTARDVRAWRDEAWSAFRRSPDAQGVGLALPRVLLRAPYGEDGEPLDTLPLEELGTPPAHRQFLWGNPALLCALLLGESFRASGWHMRPGQRREVPQLPVHAWQGPEGPGVVGCTEWPVGDDVAGVLVEEGMMLLTPTAYGATARLLRFQSVASPPGALEGPWTRAAGLRT